MSSHNLVLASLLEHRLAPYCIGRDTRGTLYCTDIAKMVDSPTFHVNADDPEVCMLAIELAMEYRQQFHKDVFIDLVCFRRLGHNEADEPAATQPVMYSVIRKHPTARRLYADRLVAAPRLSVRQLRRLVYG